MLQTSGLEQAVPAVLCNVTSQLVPATAADRLHLITSQTHRNNFVQLQDAEKRLEALTEYLKVWRAVYRCGLTGQPSSTAPIVFVWKDLCGIGGRFDAYASPAMQYEHAMCCVAAAMLHVTLVRDTVKANPKNTISRLQAAHALIGEAEFTMNNWQASSLTKAGLPLILQAESLQGLKEYITGWYGVAFALCASSKQLFKAESECWNFSQQHFSKAVLGTVPAEKWNAAMEALQKQSAVMCALSLAQLASITHQADGNKPPVGQALAALKSVQMHGYHSELVDGAVERLTRDNNSIYFQMVTLGTLENIELPALQVYNNALSDASSVTLRLI